MLFQVLKHWGTPDILCPETHVCYPFVELKVDEAIFHFDLLLLLPGDEVAVWCRYLSPDIKLAIHAIDDKDKNIVKDYRLSVQTRRSNSGSGPYLIYDVKTITKCSTQDGNPAYLISCIDGQEIIYPSLLNKNNIIRGEVVYSTSTSSE